MVRAGAIDWITSDYLLALAIALFLSSAAEARPAIPFAPVCALDGPTDGAVFNMGGSDTFYVADTDNHRIILLSDAFGCDAFVIGSEGDLEGELDQPRGVTVDADGAIYVADTGNDRIQKFDSIDGLNPGDEVPFIDVFAGVALDAPQGLGSNDLGQIFVADTGNGRVVVFNTSGNFLDSFGAPDDGDNQTDGEFIEVVDVAACPSTAAGDLAGRIFVLDGGRDTVQVFDSDLDFLFAFSGTGSAPGQLASPGGIATDHRCNVYVADTGNDRIQMFDADGGFLEILGAGNDPTGVAASGFLGQGGAGGGIYITNTGGHAINAFEYIDYDTNDDGLIDSDGDALPDIWEEDGIDIGFNGTIELDLPGLGADRDHKDLFIEIDHLDQHVPDAAALQAVVDVFAAAPIDNPDGEPGIVLNLEIDESVPETPANSDISTWGEFDVFRAARFGSQAQRAAGDDVILAKQLAYRYALWAHRIDDSSISGRAGGNRFVVSLGDANWTADPTSGHPVGDLEQQAGTFMHELGHTLGLKHGGGDPFNFKPNYLSVMSYWYQTSWITSDISPASNRLDYSGQALDALDETALDETQGIGLDAVETPDDLAAWSDPNFVSRKARVDGPLDWDWSDSGVGADTGITADINRDRVCVDPGPDDVLDSSAAGDDLVLDDRIHDGMDRTCDSAAMGDDLQGAIWQKRRLGDAQPIVLEGHDDWEYLNTTPKAFNFRDWNAFAAGETPESEDEPRELTAELAREIAEFWQGRAFRFTYSAKFVCVPEVGLEADALSPGRYRTVVNVHNPHDAEVVFRKKAVIARIEGQKRGPISELEEDRLESDEAMSITCPSIAARFDEAVPIGDGFVVIKSDELLDVVAVYTSRDSVDVEYITPHDAEAEEPAPEPERADLTIRLPAPTRVMCRPEQGCVHTVIAEVSNLSAVDVAMPFDVSVATHNGLSAAATLAGLAGGATETLRLTLGPGDNCYNPNCSVSAVVDPADAVPETDETNNKAARDDLG